MTPYTKKSNQAEAADQSGADTQCDDKLLMSGWTWLVRQGRRRSPQKVTVQGAGRVQAYQQEVKSTDNSLFLHFSAPHLISLQLPDPGNAGTDHALIKLQKRQKKRKKKLTQLISALHD